MLSFINKMASDENHRPCLPLKPQEKKVIGNILNTKYFQFKTSRQ